MRANTREAEQIDKLYDGRKIFFGDLHNHAATGGTSDGKRTLEHWKGALEALKMDFAAILDHRQVRHMYLPEWDNSIFICGTEPGTEITDCTGSEKGMHYNMIVPSSAELEDLLNTFEEYKFTGGAEGHFIYPNFTRARMGELIDALKARGGFFVHPHPKQVMISDDPLDYWFRDETGIEVFYEDLRSEYTKENYALWLKLLSLGKRVWACSGEDRHKCASADALTAIYATEVSSPEFLKHLRVGDFVCGSVGIRMCIGNEAMGGKCAFDSQKLIVAVDKFHPSVYNEEHTFRLDIINDRGLVASEKISCDEPSFFSYDTEDCKFYRVEIFDENTGLRIAIGNPIWNA